MCQEIQRCRPYLIHWSANARVDNTEVDRRCQRTDDLGWDGYTAAGDGGSGAASAERLHSGITTSER